MTAPATRFGEAIPQRAEPLAEAPAPVTPPTELPDASSIAGMMFALLLVMLVGGLLLRLV